MQAASLIKAWLSWRLIQAQYYIQICLSHLDIDNVLVQIVHKPIQKEKKENEISKKRTLNKGHRNQFHRKGRGPFKVTSMDR